jgi:acyl dehydratase
MASSAEGSVVDIVCSFDELPAQQGKGFTGAWLTVDQQHAEMFKESTYIPANPYRFEQSTYPEGLLEGFQLLGLLDHLSNPLIRLSEGPLKGWNYGLDRVRFVSQARAGDELRLTGSIASVREHRDGYLMTLSCCLERRDGDKPVMIADWLCLFVR